MTASAPTLAPDAATAAYPAPRPLAPLSAVLAQIRSGSRDVTEIATATGLRREAVGTVVDHLTRSGRVEVALLRSGCPAPTSPLSCRDCRAC